jgi:hypothetical protein
MTHPGQPAEGAARLQDLSGRLEETAARLGQDGVGAEDVKRLAGECAELAAQAAVELDRLARGGGLETAPGQEELL